MGKNINIWAKGIIKKGPIRQRKEVNAREGQRNTEMI
jgi:hypothetical protein